MQKYSKINAADYVKDSLLALNDTHETLLSQNSGAAFPTANLVVGMKCFRTDQNKTYTLKSISPLSWALTDDLGRDIYDAETLGGKKATDFARISTAESIEATSVSWNSLTTAGTYNKLMHGTSNANGPGVAYYFYVDVYVYADTNITQVAIAYTENVMSIRNRYNGVWSAWNMINPANYAAASHASTNTTYGAASGATYGHVRYPAAGTTGDVAESALPFTYRGAAATYNLNDYRIAGIWTLYNLAADSTNFPDGWGTGTNGACILEVIPFYSNTHVRQMLHKSSTSEFWIRYSTSATAWGIWRKMSPENYGTCSTDAGTATKTVTLSGFTLTDGSRVTVRFANTNTAVLPTLNVNSTGAKAMHIKGNRIGTGYQYLQANGIYDFIYNASLDYYEIVLSDGIDAATVGGKTPEQLIAAAQSGISGGNTVGVRMGNVRSPASNSSPMTLPLPDGFTEAQCSFLWIKSGGVTSGTTRQTDVASTTYYHYIVVGIK